MQVKVLFFGMLRELAGEGSELLQLHEGSTLADLISHYEQRIPRLKDFVSSIAMAVNQQYAGSDCTLKEGDEIALLPPVSGGVGQADAALRHAAIVRDVIDTASLLSAIKKGEDG